MGRQPDTVHNNPQLGFSVLELLVVASVVAIASAMAAPVLLSARRGYQLRSATTDLASFFQRARLVCVQQNRVIPIRRNAGNTQVYLDSFPTQANGGPNGLYDLGQGEPMVQMPPNITVATGGAPAFPAGSLGFAPQPTPARFDGRGLPCELNGPVCSNFVGNQVGFVYYLNQNINGNVGWAAVSITPGGQVKAWSYSGATWRNN